MLKEAHLDYILDKKPKKMKAGNEELQEIKRENIPAAKVAEIIGVCRNTLRRYGEIGALPSFKIGGRVFYKQEDVKQFLNGGKHGTSSNTQ